MAYCYLDARNTARAAFLEGVAWNFFCASKGRLRPHIYFRPMVEPLEPREMLDAGLPQAIVVGRTLTSYTTASIVGQRETISYTVYNEQGSPISGVLLTDTLQAGVAFQSASQLPDRDGQNLAWSLGTIPGFGRAGVTLTVFLPSVPPLQLDAGAHAFGMLNAGIVADDAPSAILRQGSIDPTMLASTPDANITDPFIQEKAAALDYKAQAIFDFLHNEIRYNSYPSSLRGARGTLWSSAGNALDVASLGVALMRASGIAAQYVHGTLDTNTAKDLILSMFPASYQTVGNIPTGTKVADPANDPQLLAEAKAHYWFQFDAGQGFQNADPLLVTFIGPALTLSEGTFTEVPDSLREKTRVTVTAETYSTANAAFGGTGLTTTAVIDQTFNDVDLVGRPITVGHFVSQNPVGGFGFTTVTYTYSPYLRLGDDAYDMSVDQLIRGSDYQEVLTNFPLGSQIMTGLFLTLSPSGPQGINEASSKTLVDRIGFAARQDGGTISIAPIDSSLPPIITPFDLYTVSFLSGGRTQSSVGAPRVAQSAAEFTAFAAEFNAASPDQQTLLTQRASKTIIDALIALQRSEIVRFEVQATFSVGVLGNSTQVVGYPDGPRITIASSQLVAAADGSENSSLRFGFDILKSTYRVVIAGGQSLATQVAFNVNRGFVENIIEGSVMSPPTGSSLSFPVSTDAIFLAASAQGIPLITLTTENSLDVNRLSFSAEVKARISAALALGNAVVVPSQSVTINEKQQVGWYVINVRTGETSGVLPDGSHGAEEDALLLFVFALSTNNRFRLGFIAGFFNGSIEKTVALMLISPLLLIDPFLSLATLYKNTLHTLQRLEQGPPPGISDPIYILGYKAGIFAAFVLVADPPLPPQLIATQRFNESNVANSSERAFPATATAGEVQGALALPSVHATGSLSALWNSTSADRFEFSALIANVAVVRDANGQAVGSGAIVLSATMMGSISGTNTYAVFGTGSLSFYGRAGTTLGVSGEWDNYTANVTGDVTITLTTDRLVLNGHLLPLGMYTITTSAAMLSGSGRTSSPTFAGSGALTAADGTVTLGGGTGSLTVGGHTIDASNGVTLTEFTGIISVTGNSTDNDAITLDGEAANLLRVSANSAVSASAAVSISIDRYRGLQNHFDHDVQILAVPGTADFILFVHNSGNVEDAFTATISGVTGPVSAQLMDLGGLSTQTIPVFRLPAFATGAILVRADLAAAGQGIVTVQVRSLTDESIHGASVAMVQTLRQGTDDPSLPGTPTTPVAVAPSKAISGSAPTGTSLFFNEQRPSQFVVGFSIIEFGINSPIETFVTEPFQRPVLNFGAFGDETLIQGVITIDNGNDGDSRAVGVTVRLTIMHNDGRVPETFLAITNDRGEYEFRGVPTGVYRLSVDLPAGFGQAFPPRDDGHRFEASVRGRRFTGINFRLVRLPRQANQGAPDCRFDDTQPVLTWISRNEERNVEAEIAFEAIPLDVPQIQNDGDAPPPSNRSSNWSPWTMGMLLAIGSWMLYWRVWNREKAGKIKPDCG